MDTRDKDRDDEELRRLTKKTRLEILKEFGAIILAPEEERFARYRDAKTYDEKKAIVQEIVDSYESGWLTEEEDRYANGN